LKRKDKYNLTEWIRNKTLEAGFNACGISPVEFLAEDDRRLDEWLKAGFQGEMSYLERNREKRANPALLLEGAKSVISVLLNYNPVESLTENDNYRIAKYAYGRDYHDIVRGKLNSLAAEIEQEASPMIFRAFTDSAPVFDKAWAERAGLGWVGKNTCLIHPKLGSFVFIGEIITTLELDYNTSRVNDLCGGCTKCLDACPTGAIVAPRVLDARRCISYLTIEFKGQLPEDYRTDFKDYIFGCDICQDCCPWNKKAVAGSEPAFRPSPELFSMNKEKWDGLTEGDFQNLFSGSAVKRAKFTGLRRNIDFLGRDV
jgi:epoxyqueuosine reductase